MVQFKKEEVEQMIGDILSTQKNEKEQSYLSKQDFLKKYQIEETQDWKVDDLVKFFSQAGKKAVKQVNYRPFDCRFCFYDNHEIMKNVIPRGDHRFEFMQHFVGEENLGLIFVRNDNKQLGTYFSISNLITERHFLDSAADSMRIAPLYLKNLSSQQNQVQNSNLASDLFSAKASETKDLNTAKTENFTAEFREFVNKKYGQKYEQKYGQKISPEAILGYVYAVLHSSNYRAKYLEFLKIDFPRVPFVDDVEIFKKLSDLGSELIEVHLLKKTPQSSIGVAKTTDKNFDYICQKPIFKTQTAQLFFNKTSYFENVSEQIFEFKIGGYQVLDKFLNERKGRNLSFDEINHLTKTIKALEFSILQMAKISEIF